MKENDDKKPDIYKFKINSVPNVKDNNTFIKDSIGFDKKSTNKVTSVKIIPK